MFILLPNRIEGLPKLESKMNQGFLEEAIGNLDEAEMHIAIPKFKVEVNIKLKEILVSMGMADLFDEGLADFSGISEKDGLHISDIFHTSLIDVNEEGSEAAAATGLFPMFSSDVLVLVLLTFKIWLYGRQFK